MSANGHRRLRWLAVLVLIGLPIGLNVLADGLPQYQVKAALLYKLSKFVEWPASAFANENAPFGICVLGRDPFGDSLEPLARKAVAGRRIAVSRLQALSQVDSDCQIVYLSRSEEQHAGAILQTLATLPVLTISDMDRFNAQAGIVQLITARGRIRFSINLGSARRAGLRISAQLLEIAAKVHGAHEPNGS